MSAGDAVCTGWLVKSPPERKLQRYAWRRRWFVLRRGRMSGDRDVLEYYRSQRATKPLRAIDLSDCAVSRHAGPGFVRKEFQNRFVFIVKTAARTFYLVAKTEEEMQVWVHSITQVCNFGHLQGGAADPVESLARTPCSLQPSRASSLHAAPAVGSPLPRDDPSLGTVAPEESGSESDFLSLPDYLILSNCETGRLPHASLPARCDSWSTSERSLEQTSFDDVFVDGLQPLASAHLPAAASRPGSGLQEGLCRPQALRWGRECARPTRDPVSSSRLLETSLSSSLQADKAQGVLSYGVKELDSVPTTPPPRPPKPSHLLEWREEPLWGSRYGSKKPSCYMVPRRISLSSLEGVSTGAADAEGPSSRHRDKRLSLNLPCRFSPGSPSASSGAQDGYVPMGPHVRSRLGLASSSDEYIPMSSGGLSSPLPVLPVDLEPPPVNRDLKPQRKPRPPPLDLRSLSTIREHAALSRTHTVPCNRSTFLSPERNGFNSARFFASPVSREEEESYIPMEHRMAGHVSTVSGMWTKKFSLDYLALDFNTSSPAPAQQKLLSEEHRVDYVQVDEQKTQALQSTKQEWSDERQSKA
ncbi:GRB2-associated-binding protein 3 isoform X1 [Erinaceus europaeus]|uniref:GRB2-associated-binding protein 3 isoform X1 n=1 Tax=Erinaceus europaeus TaxID=9365 RepID=A0ABM3WRI3_ERIEU|nr:GRB2-associated-binding protein 3 isoform X1 [Erinaceus europaeus]